VGTQNHGLRELFFVSAIRHRVKQAPAVQAKTFRESEGSVTPPDFIYSSQKGVEKSRAAFQCATRRLQRMMETNFIVKNFASDGSREAMLRVRPKQARLVLEWG
jgi:hypothetical protein